MSISADIAARAADRLRVQSQTGLWSLHDLIRRQSPLLHACLLPKPAGKLHGINACLLPPRALVACAVQFPMVPAAEGDCEFVARFAAQRAWLHVAQVVGIGWLAAADEAWLLHDVAKVLAVTIASRRGNGKDALVDALCLTSVGVFGGDGLLLCTNLRHRRPVVRECRRIG